MPEKVRYGLALHGLRRRTGPLVSLRAHIGEFRSRLIPDNIPAIYNMMNEQQLELLKGGEGTRMVKSRRVAFEVTFGLVNFRHLS